MLHSPHMQLRFSHIYNFLQLLYLFFSFGLLVPAHNLHKTPCRKVLFRSVLCSEFFHRGLWNIFCLIYCWHVKPEWHELGMYMKSSICLKLDQCLPLFKTFTPHQLRATSWCSSFCRDSLKEFQTCASRTACVYWLVLMTSFSFLLQRWHRRHKNLH